MRMTDPSSVRRWWQSAQCSNSFHMTYIPSWLHALNHAICHAWTGITGQRAPGWTLATLMLAAVMAVCLCLTFALWTTANFLDAIRFPVAITVLYFLPGSQIVRWLRLDVGTLEYLLLSLVLGTVATCSIYPVLAWVGKPLLLWVWIFVAFLSLILSADTLFSRFQNAQIERAHFLLLLAILASWLPLYLLNFFFRNLTAAGQGAVTYFARIDVILHTSIAAELSHSIPPQLPWMAGLPLSYHVGMDLVASVLNRYTGLAVPDLVVRFVLSCSSQSMCSQSSVSLDGLSARLKRELPEPCWASWVRTSPSFRASLMGRDSRGMHGISRRRPYSRFIL